MDTFRNITNRHICVHTYLLKYPYAIAHKHAHLYKLCDACQHICTFERTDTGESICINEYKHLHAHGKTIYQDISPYMCEKWTEVDTALYVYTHTYIDVCVYLNLWIQVCTYETHRWIHVYIHTNVIHTQICSQAWMHANKHKKMNAHAKTWECTYVGAHKHTSDYTYRLTYMHYTETCANMNVHTYDIVRTIHTFHTCVHVNMPLNTNTHMWT